MPRFQRTTVGKLRYDIDAAPVDYLEVECGGGGDCLFLSLAWALARAGIPTTAGALRAAASATLVSWAPPNGVPDIVDTLHVPMPGLPAAQRLATTGEWGDLACIVAIVDQLCSNGRDVAVHVLGPTENDVLIVRSGRAVDVNPTAAVHIVFKSFMHFRALVPAGADISAITSRLVSNYDTITADSPPVKKIQASLNRKRGLSDKGGLATSTVNTPPGASVEIHHINVGQGDSTLVFIKDARGEIQRSILIDAGHSASAADVRRYLDAQIAKGNFRPVDVLVLSHWDEDHIGGAPALLRFNSKVGSLASVGYFNEPLQIFDVGDDTISDTHYDNYIKAVNELGLNGYRNVPVPGQVLVSCLGVTIRCLGRLEIGLYPDVGDFARNEKKAQKFKYWNVGADVIPPELLNDDDVVNLQAEPGASAKNNASIALLLTFGEFTYFSAGDLEGDAEVLMVQYARVALGRHVCAWKMSHHGSHASATSAFFYYAAPRFGVASCGTGNQHGHPGRAIQARVDQVNTLAGCACTYYVTQAVASDASQFAQPDGETAFANQGDIVIKVTEPQAKNKDHVFEVYAVGSQGALEYQCGDRSKLYPIVENHSHLVKQRDPERVAASNARRDKRKKLSEDTPRQWLYARVGEILGLAAENTAEIHGQLRERELYEKFTRVLEQLTRAYPVRADDDSMNDEEIASDRALMYAQDRFAKSFLDELRKPPK